MKTYPDKTVFGWPGDDGIGEMLIQQIIAGDKTATCSFKEEYSEQELNDLIATKGKIVTVEDHRGMPRCNIKIIDIFETKFGDPDPRLVKGEYNGGDVQKFQEDHRHAWNQTVKDKNLTDDTVLIVELFKLIEVKQ